ncbi:MAG: aromatic amino acid ammonia-lyase [Cyanobacteria bacterium P01_E01_bin.42]
MTISVSSLPFVRSASGIASGNVVVGEKRLTIDDVANVARHHVQVHLSQKEEVQSRVLASREYIDNAVKNGKPIYGVTTGFGGMANQAIASEEVAELQSNLIWFLKAGAGKRLPDADVRAAMLLRVNALMQGASGIRPELIERLTTFLNAGVTPHVCEFGSIGASGDLVPLAHITGAAIGLDESFTVDYNGREMSALQALEMLELEPIDLLAKEGLAMTNGTSVMTGIASLCVRDAKVLLSLGMGAHALMLQGLGGTNQSFHPFIHQLKPHFGQRWSAQKMIELLEGSGLSRDELDGTHDNRGHELIQDRYSLRCLPQYIGPIADGILDVAQQMEVELNSVTDNPLIDIEKDSSYHCGNFLGQYVGVGMDRVRHLLGLLAKHLDVQIALLVAPEFSGGLTPSLVGNTERKVNMGLKGLQIAGNSLMPLLTFYGNSIADRYPTHAEQFNQNVNSQGFASANLARTAIEIFHQYMAISLMFSVQAVDLRTHLIAGHYNSPELLSPATLPLYNAVREIIGKPASDDRPYIWNDCDQALNEHIALIAADIATEGKIVMAVKDTLSSLSTI